MENILAKKPDINSEVEQNNSIPEMQPIEEMKRWYEMMREFGKEILKINIDYGLINGTEKPALLKPGAEKIKRAFSLQIESIDCIKETVDLESRYIDYTYKCIVTSKSGIRLGICDGNANSKEDKFRYIYKPAEKVPPRKEIEKLKTEGKGKWKKSGEKWLWMERVENPDVLSLKNSIQKFAQKRAFVGAILMASGTSEFFTQDIQIN